MVIKYFAQIVFVFGIPAYRFLDTIPYYFTLCFDSSLEIEHAGAQPELKAVAS